MADVAAPKVVITGTGAVCAGGMQPDEILAGVVEGRCTIGPIRQWDTTNWPTHLAGEIPDFNARALVEDRKLHKLIRRTDLVGLYAASRAIERAGGRIYGGSPVVKMEGGRRPYAETDSITRAGRRRCREVR